MPEIYSDASITTFATEQSVCGDEHLVAKVLLDWIARFVLPRRRPGGELGTK